MDVQAQCLESVSSILTIEIQTQNGSRHDEWMSRQNWMWHAAAVWGISKKAKVV